MSAKHAPGPWHYQEHGQLILDSRSGSSQTLVATVATNTFRDEGRHNAHLIAAAPWLLEACQMAARYLDPAQFPDAMRVIDAAIAKATGGAA